MYRDGPSLPDLRACTPWQVPSRLEGLDADADLSTWLADYAAGLEYIGPGLDNTAWHFIDERGLSPDLISLARPFPTWVSR